MRQPRPLEVLRLQASGRADEAPLTLAP